MIAGMDLRRQMNRRYDLGVHLAALHSWESDVIDYSAGLDVGVTFAKNIWVSVGYNFLYWSSVVRPGEQIDRRLDVTQIPNFSPPPSPPFGPTLPTNPQVPQRLLKDSDFWAHGLTAGIEIRF